MSDATREEPAAGSIRRPAIGEPVDLGSMRTTTLVDEPDLLRSEIEATGAAGGGPLHRHLRQEERFVVTEGTLEVRVGLRGRELVGPGESISVPPGTPHTFRVAGESARFTAEFRPALQISDYFLELFSIEEPGLRDLARLAQRYPVEHFYLPIIPPRVQRLLLRPFA